jgi:hypothetical protein
MTKYEIPDDHVWPDEKEPEIEFGSVVDNFLPTAIKLGIHALWQAGGSQQYIEGVVMQTDAQLGDIENKIVAARTAYEDAMGAFTGGEVCVLVDRTDAEKQALAHLLATPSDASQANEAVTTLFSESLSIATESTSDQFRQRVPESEAVREEARSMVGGAAITIDALDQLADCHPDVDRDELSFLSRDAAW